MRTICVNKHDLTDRIIWILTIFLMSSFLIFNLIPLGSYLLLAITGLIGLLSGLQHKLRFGLTVMHIFILIFSFYCLLSGLWAYNYRYAVEKGMTILEILVCISVLYMHYHRFDSIDSLLAALMWSGVFVSFYYFGTYGFANILRALSLGARTSSTFTNINSIAMLSSYAILIAAYFAMSQRKLIQLVMVALPCIMIIASSGSRKAAIALILGISLLFSHRYASSQLFVMLFKIILIIVAMNFFIRFLASIQLFSGLASRMESLLNFFTGEGEIDFSTRQREYFIAVGLEQFAKTPFLGIGIGNPRILAAKYTGHNAYLHNNFVELLAGGGIIGFSLYYAMYAYIAWNMFKHRKQRDQQADLMVVFLMVMLVLDYGAVSYYAKETYFILMIFFLYCQQIRLKALRNLYA